MKRWSSGCARYSRRLAPAADKGWGRVGPVGSGHYAKMIHNGIEYGMMQAYAEGLSILQHKTEFELRPAPDRRNLAPRQRGALLAARSDRERAGEESRRCKASRLSCRFGRGPLDRRRGDRARRAGHRDHARRCSSRFSSQDSGFVRRQTARRHAQPVRRSRRSSPNNHAGSCYRFAATTAITRGSDGAAPRSRPSTRVRARLPRG